MQLSLYGPMQGTLAMTRSLWSGIAHRISGVTTAGGDPVYSREWDLLVVLDACRVDALEQLTHEYDFLPNTINAVRSVAPNSNLWLDRTFKRVHIDDISQTIYVTANGHAEGFQKGSFDVDSSHFRDIKYVYEYGFDEQTGTIPPREVTKEAIKTFRHSDFSRGIIHYMQPHTPYRGLDLDGLETTAGKTFRETVWDWIASGRLSKKEAWGYYLDNLRWVLDDVEVLLENVDAERVVITADHGEAFGEWGAYGHSPYGEFEGLRQVPWVVTDSEDSRTYQPEINRDNVDTDVEEQLKHLGYQ